MIDSPCPQIHQKYKFMESSLASRRRKLKSQVGSFATKVVVTKYIVGSWHKKQPGDDHQVERKEGGELSMLKMVSLNIFLLQAEETMETQFLLSEQVYARAKVVSSIFLPYWYTFF